MDIDRDKNVAKNKRKVKLIKRLVVLGVILFLIIYFSIKSVNDKTIYKLGEKVDSLYSQTNFIYKEINVGNNNEYTLIKRLDDLVYYENNKNNVKNIYYFDLKRDRAWRILEDEKIVITDDLLNFTPNILSGKFENVYSSYGENYVFSYYNNKAPSTLILSFKSLRNKIIEGNHFYELVLKTSEGEEKTYFDKNTLMPVKSIVKDKKEIVTEYIIEISENVVTKQDITIPSDYKIMTNLDYMEYKRVMGI